MLYIQSVKINLIKGEQANGGEKKGATSGKEAHEVEEGEEAHP
jgi:hypothetical protein